MAAFTRLISDLFSAIAMEVGIARTTKRFPTRRTCRESWYSSWVALHFPSSAWATKSALIAKIGKLSLVAPKYWLQKASFKKSKTCPLLVSIQTTSELSSFFSGRSLYFMGEPLQHYRYDRGRRFFKIAKKIVIAFGHCRIFNKSMNPIYQIHSLSKFSVASLCAINLWSI